ncbi:putative transcription factor bHLH family [Helianthus annuus]|nr:putative transcription factor bHLH family [Helianthus annuus]
MMGENPNYWWSLNGKLQTPSSQQAFNPTFLSTPQLPLPLPLPLPVPPPSSILNPPYLFGSSLLVPAPNPNALADHQHHENQDFPVSWSQLLMNGLANDQEHQNLRAAHVGEVKYGYLDNQQSRQLYNNYSNKNDHHGNNNSTEEDLQACSSSWSPQLPSVGSSSTMSLSTTTMFDFSSKIDSRNQHANQYSSQYDDTSTSGVSKRPRFQSSSIRPNSPMESNDTFTSGTSKRARPQHSSTQTPLKVRKEKLGDRISALHQLVSPFGKTDTASVLLEATAQIRFLEGQIEALSSPYMNLANNVSGGTRHQHTPDGKTLPKDLASRGLCLVPVSCMDHIDTTNMTTNGAEFWTPALGGGF